MKKALGALVLAGLVVGLASAPVALGQGGEKASCCCCPEIRKERVASAVTALAVGELEVVADMTKRPWTPNDIRELKVLLRDDGLSVWMTHATASALDYRGHFTWGEVQRRLARPSVVSAGVPEDVFGAVLKFCVEPGTWQKVHDNIWGPSPAPSK